MRRSEVLLAAGNWGIAMQVEFLDGIKPTQLADYHAAYGTGHLRVELF